MLPTIMGGWFDVGRWFECWAGHCRTHNPSSRCTHLWLQEMMIMMTLFMKSGCEWEIGMLFTAARQTWSQREMFFWIRSSLPSFRVPTTSPIDFNVSFVAGLQNSLVCPKGPHGCLELVCKHQNLCTRGTFWAQRSLQLRPPFDVAVPTGDTLMVAE